MFGRKPGTSAALLRYIRRIRNADKRQYAAAYVLHLTNSQVNPEPERGALSCMAAQAVRMNVDGIWQKGQA